MKKLLFSIALFCSLFLIPSDVFGEIKEIWMTFAREKPTHVNISWISDRPGESTVLYGTTETELKEETIPGDKTLHHVEIPFYGLKSDWVYQVRTGADTSKRHRVDGWTDEELRIAVIGNFHGNISKVDLKPIMKRKIHLLATGGDNISTLQEKGVDGDAAKTNIKPFRKMVSRYQDVFSTVPFMPVLGNHDRQIRSRGTKERPPSEPVYDIEATAYSTFFSLPDPGWAWKFEIPDFGLRLIALDLNHISDLGNLLQTSHSYKADSEQFAWYDRISKESNSGLTVTLQNERNASIRSREGNAWHKMFRRGTIVIAGFGYYAERAQQDGFPYFNTSLRGKGDIFKDPQSRFLESRNNFILLRIPQGGKSLVVELIDIDNDVLLDSTSWPQ